MIRKIRASSNRGLLRTIGNSQSGSIGRLVRHAAAATLLIFFSAIPTQAVPLPNDECSGATVIASLPFFDPATLWFGGATANATDPPACVRSSSHSGPPTVWYRYTPTANVRVTVERSFGAYTGSCGALTPVACSGDSVPNSSSPYLSPNDYGWFEALAGEEYFIMVTSDSRQAGVTISACGDSIVQSGFEQCDDGNSLGGDGCDAKCQAECWTCDGMSCSRQSGTACAADSKFALNRSPSSGSATDISDDGKILILSYQELYSNGTMSIRQIRAYDRISLETSKVSVNDVGVEGNGASDGSSLSADGRFVAFHSIATNFDSDASSTKKKIYLRDRISGTTERVSYTSTGQKAYGSNPSISADGRYVAFESTDANIVTGDSNGMSDVFVRDRVLGTNERVSVDSSGQQGNGASGNSDISADGRYVLFSSAATNLIPGGSDGALNYFVHDRVTGVTTRVNVNSMGERLNVDIYSTAKISGNGRFVAFEQYVHDRATGKTEQYAVMHTPSPDDGYLNNLSWYTDYRVYGSHPLLSADGRFVLFASSSKYLVPGDTNGVYDVFLRDRAAAGPMPDGDTLATQRISLTSFGTQILAPHYNDTYRIYPVALSGDGRHMISGAGISDDCSTAVCGDGQVAPGCETCDDGNTTDADGCSATCKVQNCYACTGEPSDCAPKVDGTSCADACHPGAVCGGGACLGPDLCLGPLCGTSGPCVISQSATLPGGAVLDLEGRSLQVTGPGTVLESAGVVSIRNAASVVIDEGSTIVTPGAGGTGDGIAIGSSGPCTLNGNLRTTGSTFEGDSSDSGNVIMACEGITLGSKARIDVKGVTTSTMDGLSAGLPGTIVLQASGGSFSSAKGSKIDATAKGIRGGDVHVSAAGACTWGSTLSAHSKTVTHRVDGTQGGEGGSLSVRCAQVTLIKGTNVSLGKERTAEAGRLSLQSTAGPIVVEPGARVADDGMSGVLEVTASDACTLAGSLRSNSRGWEAGDLQLRCANITLAKGFKYVAASAGGTAGSVDAQSPGMCLFSGAVLLKGSSTKIPASEGGGINIGRGGKISARCAGGVSVAPAPGAAGAGPLSVSSGGVDSEAGSMNLVSSAGPVTIAALLSAEGPSVAGSITAEGCDVTLAKSGKISVRSGLAGGDAALIAHESLEVNGTMTAVSTMAGGSDGGVELRYRDTGVITQPNKITPASGPTQDAALRPCT